MTIFRRRRRLPGLRRAAFMLLLAGAPAAVFAEPMPSSAQVRVVDDGNGVFRFVADNPNVIAFSVEISFRELTNFDADADLPFMAVVPPGVQGHDLLALSKTDADQPSRYDYRFSFWPGDYSLEPDEDHVYLAPWRHGTKHRVVNGYGSETSDGTTNRHFGGSQYALDITMDTGTPVVAARGGTVTDVKEESDVGGLDIKFLGTANFVRVYHDDGTQATYAHLMLNGAAVETGDRVEAGQIIGYSGDTGYSGGPHLHFEVDRIIHGDEGRTTWQSIPTLFAGLDGGPITLDEGRYYYSTHAAKDPFTAILGEALTNADYEGVVEPVPGANQIAIDWEKVDDTYVFFAENATDRAREFTLSLSLTNMTASKPLPHQQVVPANSRVYLLLVRAIDPAEASTFGAQYDVK